MSLSIVSVSVTLSAVESVMYNCVVCSITISISNANLVLFNTNRLIVLFIAVSVTAV